MSSYRKGYIMDARTEGFAAMLGSANQNECLMAARKLEKHLGKTLGGLRNDWESQ